MSHSTTQSITAPGDPRASTVEIRPVDATDAPGLAGFYETLSAESRRLRFLGGCSGLAPASCRALCAVDHEHAEGLVAVLRQPGPEDGRIVGHLCLVPDDADGLELALAVADAFQGQGIGRRLFVEALAWARGHGVRTVIATSFADNAPVLRLLTSASEGATVRLGGAGVVDVEIPIGSPAQWPD